MLEHIIIIGIDAKNTKDNTAEHTKRTNIVLKNATLCIVPVDIQKVLN